MSDLTSSEKEFDVQAVKDRLLAYREAEREIDTQSEALERIRVRMEGIGAQNITDMPKSPSGPTDRYSDLVSRKIEIEQMIGYDVEKQKQERDYFEGILRKLKKADERAVIRFRYFHVLSWNEVTNAMFGAKVDYLDKEDSYLRRVTVLHGRALLHIAMCIAGEKL